MGTEELVKRERERCVGICRRRAELWRATSATRSAIASVREEARARANEAAYLADLLASGVDLSKSAGVDGDAPDASNVALLRTHLLRIRSGRSVCSLGSPLNARPSGGFEASVVTWQVSKDSRVSTEALALSPVAVVR